MTPAPWRWLGAGADASLVGFHGRRPVVLTTLAGVAGAGRHGHLAHRDARGLLGAFDPNSDDGRVMAAAPELLAALRAYQAANRIKHDSDGALFDLAAPILEALKDIK